MEVKSLKGKSVFVKYKYLTNLDNIYHNLQYTFKNKVVNGKTYMIFQNDNENSLDLELSYEMYNDLCNKGYHINDYVFLAVDKRF